MGAEKHVGQVLTFFVAKGMYCGNGMRFGRHAVVDDGRFDIIVFEDISSKEMLLSLRRLYTGDFGPLKNVKSFKAEKIQIESPDPLPYEVDGEVGISNQLSLTVVPQAIKVCFPKQ